MGCFRVRWMQAYPTEETGEFQVLKNTNRNGPLFWHQDRTRLALGFSELVDLLNFLRQERSIRDLMEFMNWRDRTK